MKILKAKIEVSHANGGTEYLGYPAMWLAHKEKIPAILYPTDRSDEIEEGGKTYQFVYPCVPDDVADILLSSPDGLITLADQSEVVAYADKHLPSREIISDQSKVLAIVAKAARGEKLNEAEVNALDPEHPDEGVTKTKPWLDRVTEAYGVTWD